MEDRRMSKLVRAYLIQEAEEKKGWTTGQKVGAAAGAAGLLGLAAYGAVKAKRGIHNAAKKMRLDQAEKATVAAERAAAFEELQKMRGELKELEAIISASETYPTKIDLRAENLRKIIEAHRWAWNFPHEVN